MSYINMGNLKLKERRDTARQQLSGLLPGIMVRISNQKCISCKPVDVSVGGLGILSSEHLKIGEKLQMIIGDTKIQLEVVWSKPDFGKYDLTRYGLKSQNSEIDLIKKFVDCGMIGAK